MNALFLVTALLAQDASSASTLVAFPVAATARVEVDALAATLIVTGTKTIPASSLCPQVSASKGVTTIRCSTRKVRAYVETDARGSRLVIARLHGAPSFDGNATLPVFFYDPTVYGLGGACPGTTAAGRGECALHRGDLDTAVDELGAALGGVHNAHAAVRLGDIAQLLGDDATAAEFWDRAGAAGIFARLAALRLCDVMGACLNPKSIGLTYNPFDLSGLPSTAKDEAIARKARVLAYEGDLAAATATFLENESSCQNAASLCGRIALQRLREGKPGDNHEALVLAAVLGPRLPVKAQAELAQRVADEAVASGADLFAAGVLTAAADGAPKQRQEAVLLRAASLYAGAGDVAHAAVIVRYAETSLRPLRQPSKWKELSSSLSAARAESTESTERNAP